MACKWAICCCKSATVRLSTGRFGLVAGAGGESAERLGAEHATAFYVVPEGGSNALGALGYVRCAEELCDQLGRVPATIVCAAYPVPNVSAMTCFGAGVPRGAS